MHKAWSKKEDKHPAQVLDIAWNVDGSLLGTGGMHLRFYEFTPNGFYLACSVDCCRSPITALKFYDSNVCASMTRHSLQIRDARSNIPQPIMSMKAKIPLFTNFDWNVPRNWLTIVQDNTLETYDLRMGGAIEEMRTPIPGVIAVDIAWDPSGNVLICGGSDSQGNRGVGKIAALSHELQEIMSLSLHSESIIQISRGKVGQRLITMGDDCLIEVHDMVELLCESTISLPQETKKVGVCRLNGPETLLAASYDTQMSIFDVKRGNKVVLERKFEDVTIMDWNPRLNCLAMSGISGKGGITCLVL